MSNYNFDKLQNENNFEHKVRLCVAKLNKEHDYDWSELINLLNLDCSSDHLRKLSYGYKEMTEEQGYKLQESLESNYKETNEIMKDGSHKSDKLIAMSAEQSKDVKYLLSAHGFDPLAWELISARNNMRNTNDKVSGIKTLYSSNVSVKPLVNSMDINKLIDNAVKNVKPIKVSNIVEKGNGLLEIPLFDLHFGIADLEYYKPTYEKIIDKIKNKQWDTILFIIGQDIIHTDGFRGKTTAGTIIESVDVEKAFNDALSFYKGLIESALENSVKVDIIFSSGNHDETIGYGFIRTIDALFPQVKVDYTFKTRKGYVWNKVFIATTHGDKGHARMTRNVMDEFRNEILGAKVAEIHSGHLHSEKSKDDFGIVSRTLGTGAKTDLWHYEQGFVGSMKRFQLFEYSYDSLDSIYYI